MLKPRTLTILRKNSPLRHALKRASARVLPAKNVRFVSTDKEELGGVGGSEPPGPQPNPVNWKAGTITAAGVLLAGWWMLRSKKEAKP